MQCTGPALGIFNAAEFLAGLEQFNLLSTSCSAVPVEVVVRIMLEVRLHMLL